MNSQIILKDYHSLQKSDISEVLRYLGAKEGDASTLSLIYECIKEAEGKISARICYREFDIKKTDGILDLGFAKTGSKALLRNLEGCGRIILFAATLGAEADRLMLRYTRTSPARAVVLDALLSERIEDLCDTFERDIVQGELSRPRFSAGYGDLPLTFQKDIFAALDCERRLGLTLNESLLMSPTKSVTAVIGIKQ